MLRCQAVLDRLPSQHGVDGDVLADIAQEVEESDVAGPVTVVDQHHVVAHHPGDLGLDGGDVGRQGGLVEEIALLGTPAGIADHSRGPTGQSDRYMAGIVEATQHQQSEQIADVEAVSGRIAPEVEGDRSLRHAGRQTVSVDALLHQAAGFQVGEDVVVGHLPIVTRISVDGQTRDSRSAARRHVVLMGRLASRNGS